MSLIHQLSNSLAKCLRLNEELSTEGYSILDNVLDAELLRKLRGEIVFLDDCRALESSPNSLLGSDGEDLILTKPGIWELSLILRGKQVVGNGTMEMVPHLKSLWDKQEELLCAFQSSCKVLQSLTALDQLKVAIVKEGGAFAVHTDTHPSTGRTLSVTLYLNEDYQQDRDCGELQVFPTPYESENIAPTFGRMVLFSSCNLFHRVLPSKMEGRFCLSLMFYGSDPIFPYQNVDPRLPQEIQDEFFSQRRVLTPLIYQEEFKRSIKEAFSSEAQQEKVHSAIGHFISNCERAKSILGPSLLDALSLMPMKRKVVAQQ